MGLYLCSTAWEHGRARLELGRRDNYATVRRGDGDLQKNRESKSHSRGNLEINPVLCTEGIASETSCETEREGKNVWVTEWVMILSIEIKVEEPVCLWKG